MGRYSLDIVSSLDGEPLAGSPFQFEVTPGQLSPCHSTAALATAGSALVAGQDVEIYINAKDEHGNKVRPFHCQLV